MEELSCKHQKQHRPYIASDASMILYSFSIKFGNCKFIFCFFICMAGSSSRQQQATTAAGSSSVNTISKYNCINQIPTYSIARSANITTSRISCGLVWNPFYKHA